MSQESWMSVFRLLSYIGLLFVFISTVGISIFQSGVDKAKDQRIDTLISGNNELLSKNIELVTKVDQYQHDIETKNTRIEELEIGVKKASRGITSTYDFNGAKRETSAGRIRAIAGEEMGVYQRIVEFEKNRNYPELINICKNQIVKTPEWLTPYLFLGIAYTNIGEKDEAISNLEYVVTNAPSDPDYSQAKIILDQIRKQK